MQAVILAGGKGTRLAERLQGRPKPLVDVCGEPLLKRQLDLLFSQGIQEVVLLVNHRADQIAAFVDTYAHRERVSVVDDGEPKGTAGALLAAMRRLRERFLVVYGDTLFDIDLQRLVAVHDQRQADVTLLIHPNDHPADSDLVELDGEGWIRAFHGYPHPAGAALGNLVNAAMYVCERRALAEWEDLSTPSDLAKDLFPRMLARGARLFGYETYEYIKDLGTPRRLDKVERHLREGVVARARRNLPQRAVFVDRDGTLNFLSGHIRIPEQLVLLPGAASGVRRLNDAEYRVVLVTNQPVLARGECDDQTMRRIHAKLQTDLGDEGAYLDRIELCPHHPDSGFPGEVALLKRPCDCRKPEPGMLLAAAADMNIDLAQSWMVGDTSRDVACAARAGVTSILVKTGEAGLDGFTESLPDFVMEDLEAAADLIVRRAPALVEFLAEETQGGARGDVVLSGGSEQDRRSVRAALRMMPCATVLEATNHQGGNASISLDVDSLAQRFLKAELI